MTDINTLRDIAFKEIQTTNTLDSLSNFEIKYLGRKGEINELLKKISSLSKEEKVSFGQEVNNLKAEINLKVEEKRKELKNREVEKLKNKWLDVTAPAIKPHLGHLHPITQIIHELSEIFAQMGYEIHEGPEVETDYYNFEVLNIPKDHPARDLQDTFWLTNGTLPRTHTSAMQVRVMEKLKPPFKIAVPGWVFRSEREDATHASAFFHFEAFRVGDKIAFSDLKGTLFAILQRLLGYKTKLKFRASYFPYVEPCAEVSASCPYCNEKGCPACGGSGWLEILGSGMIHPTVLKNAHIDPEKYSGFAFSFGPNRLAMIKYGIKDIRLFTGGDLRFNTQF